MAVVNHHFHATFTEDTASHPAVDVKQDWMDSSSSNDDKQKVYIPASVNTVWMSDIPVKVLDVSAETAYAPNGQRARYLVIETNSPVYLWFENDPTVAVGSPIVAVPICVERMMMIEGPLTGSIQKIWAVNPSRTTDPNPVTVELKMWYTLVNL